MVPFFADTGPLKWVDLDRDVFSRTYPSPARDLFQADTKSEFQTFFYREGGV